ncbi:hypothetical protein [Actibacterium sp. MT2.3-13A]|uniref:hypothetical protein n=1 Tax=Actibacterium sp. MT2.3-13A TaxID=2828332 RepID=UPI001BAC97EE|nr:hypothetical protein [Actibacterium sp. MT2.3-13A]
MGADEADPRGLIREAYRIEGITEADCRSIFLDWALGVPPDADLSAQLRLLLERYAPEAPDHPMNGVLRAGLEQGARPRRRGGWRGRDRD